jgi:hypothetical protein
MLVPHCPGVQAGSKMGDFCAWLWCPIMALCQETRTLAANNVEVGSSYNLRKEIHSLFLL